MLICVRFPLVFEPVAYEVGLTVSEANIWLVENLSVAKHAFSVEPLPTPVAPSTHSVGGASPVLARLGGIKIRDYKEPGARAGFLSQEPRTHAHTQRTNHADKARQSGQARQPDAQAQRYPTTRFDPVRTGSGSDRVRGTSFVGRMASGAAAALSVGNTCVHLGPQVGRFLQRYACARITRALC